MTNIDAYDILEEGGEYMIQILICDDNPLHSEEIQVMIQKLIPKDITVNYIKTKSKEESLNYIRKGQEHSWIIFMDILLSDKENGIEIAQEIQKIIPTAQIIFVTGYMEWCTKAGRADPIYFLTKPIEEDDLKFAVKKAFEHLKQDRVFFRQKGKVLSIPVADIIYAERNLRQTNICSISKEIYTVSDKIEDLLKLLDPITFVSPHKSFLVNLQYVTSITSQEIVLCKEYSIPISHTKSKKIKQQYMTYINGLI